MKKILSLAVVFTVALAVVSLSSCKDRSHTHADKHMHKHDKDAKALNIKTAQKICPVMGGAIDKRNHVVHKGQVIFFCCAHCIKEFKKSPEKYMKKLKDVKLPVVPKDDIHKGHKHS